MLRQVFIYHKSQRMYSTHFGKALDEDSFTSVFKKLQQEAFIKGRDPNLVGSYDFYKYRISYIASPDKELIYIFVTDLTDSVENIKNQLIICRREFLELFEDVLGQQFDSETFQVFQPTIEKVHKELRPKISLVGFSGVGKTTITRLIRAEEIPMEHVPTITGEIGTIKIGKLSFALWDFAGQEQFSFLWNKFVRGSDAVLIITDSTLENVEKSRFFVELVKQESPHAHTAIIGNKQDLPGAMPSPEIERILGGVHSYSMVAVDPHNRDKMITIIADILEMSAEVSPLLAPLIDRDKKMVVAEEALMNGDFQGAYQLFKEIADLCLELGDDSLSSEFHEKSEKVKGYLSQAAQTTPQKAPAGATPSPAAKPAGINPAQPVVFESEEQPRPQANPTPPPVPVSAPPMKTVPVAPPGLNRPPATAGMAPPGPHLLQPKPPTPGLPTKPTVANLPAVKPLGSPPAPPGIGTPLVKPPAMSSPPKPGAAPPLVFEPPPENLEADAIGTVSEEPSTPEPVKPPAVVGSPESISGPIKPPINIPKIKPPAFAQPKPVPAPAPVPTAAPPIGGGEEAPAVDYAGQRRQVQATLMDLKIKVANINKFLLDIEMKNLMGEMNDQEFQVKKQRSEQMKKMLEQQVAENQNLLNSMG